MGKMNDDIRSIIGKRLSDIRYEKNVTQKEIIEKVGAISGTELKQATLSSYEKGKTLPPIQILIALSKAYNVSLDWLCGNSNERGNIILSNCYTDIMDVIFAWVKNEKLFVNMGLGECHLGDAWGDILLYPCVFFKSDIMRRYIDELNKMLIALDQNAGIDREILELWHEKKINKYANMPENEILPF